MAKFIEITEASKNTVSHSEDVTKILQVEKIIEVNDDPAGSGAEIETQPQSFNGIPDKRIVDETQSAINAAAGDATAANPTISLSVVAVGENYPSPGYTATTVVFNTDDIVEAQEYIGVGPTELKAIDIAASITTNTTDATNGAYATTPLSGGSGSGATAEVGVEEGVVILVSVDAEAEGYKVGDVLTISASVIGGTVDVEITLQASDIIADAYSVIRLNQYRKSQQVNYVVDEAYADLKTALNV